MQLVITDTEKLRVKAEMQACGIPPGRQQRQAFTDMLEGGLECMGLQEGGHGSPQLGLRLRGAEVVDQPGTGIGDGFDCGSGKGRGLKATEVGAGGGKHEQYGRATAHPCDGLHTHADTHSHGPNTRHMHTQPWATHVQTRTAMGHTQHTHTHTGVSLPTYHC